MVIYLFDGADVRSISVEELKTPIRMRTIKSFFCESQEQSGSNYRRFIHANKHNQQQEQNRICYTLKRLHTNDYCK